MASLQILKSNFSQFYRNPEFSRKPSWIFSERIVFVQFETFPSSKYGVGRRRSRVCCGLKDGESKGEEPTESLFMKELKRRGMSSSSLYEDSKRSIYEVEESVKLKEEDRGFSKRNAVSTDFDKSLSGQRERSMMLNSEGLEGLVPRAKVLLTIGGSFFLGFGPLILVSFAIFSALYLYFGSTFIHDGRDMAVSPPQYVNPYQLLEDERISQTAPRVK